MEPSLNRMLGFTKNGVIELIEYYRAMGCIKHSTLYLMKIMTSWYGNYLFSEVDDERLYNSDMVLHFIDEYLTKNKSAAKKTKPGYRCPGKADCLVNLNKDSIKSSNEPQIIQPSIYRLDNIDPALYQVPRNDPKLMKTLDWRLFEKLMVDILETYGYSIELTRGTNLKKPVISCLRLVRAR